MTKLDDDMKPMLTCMYYCMCAAEYTLLMAGQAEIKTMLEYNTELSSGVNDKCDAILDLLNKLVAAGGEPAPAAPPPPAAPVNVSRPIVLPLKTVAEVCQMNRDLQHQPTFEAFVSFAVVANVHVVIS